MIGPVEYSASELRVILQKLFPHRRLVLSQFTFYNHCGVAKPTGDTSRRGRTCYRLTDILPIAGVIALKERGIPLKNIQPVPEMLQQHAKAVFETPTPCRLSGYGNTISLKFDDVLLNNPPLEKMLEDTEQHFFFWSFDIGLLAQQIISVLAGEPEQQITVAA